MTFAEIFPDAENERAMTSSANEQDLCRRSREKYRLKTAVAYGTQRQCDARGMQRMRALPSWQKS